MQTLTIPARDSSPAVLRCRTPRVYVDGLRRHDLLVESWDVLPAPSFGRVRLAPRGDGDRPARIEDVTLLPPTGAEVIVVADDGGEFHGLLTGHVAEVGLQGEILLAEAEHHFAIDLADTIRTYWTHDEEGIAVSAERPAVRFNVKSDRSTWASALPVPFMSRVARLFDASPTAIRWTVADALSYLLAAYVSPDAQRQSLEELLDMAGEIDLGAYDAAGKSVATVLAEVARRGGLSLRTSRQGTGLVFYRGGVQGRRRSVRLQVPVQRLSPAASNLWKGQITLGRRPCRPTVMAVGEAKMYEATFQLACGWDTNLETSQWRDFVPRLAANWTAVASVYRKWVLNEHNWYCGNPWNLPPGLPTWISPTDFFLKIPRQFQDCLSTDSAGQSLGVLVEFRCGDSDTWRPWSGPVQVASDECAIYLGGDTLPADYFQAAAARNARVRVTATIAADAHLTAVAPGDAASSWQVVDVPGMAWRQIHSSSVAGAASAQPSPAVRDDSASLQNIADRLAQATGATQAKLVLAWPNTSFHVGDIVDRIDGRGLELASRDLVRPSVTAAHHDFQAQTTTLTITG